MALVPSYLKWSRLREQEAFEPVFSWGLRMAIAAIAPVIWGAATNHTADASWITLTAECICWVELKGSFGQRLRILFGGIFLTLFFGVIGSITGSNIWLSVVTMLGVGFISGLFKNLGDRGSGLAICVYVVFIITNAYPVHNVNALEHRTLLILTGGCWNALISLLAALYTPAKEPYRRTVAIIWRRIADLIKVVAKGWDGTDVRSTIRDVYLKEKEVRAAIDTSLALYYTMAHQVTAKDAHEYQLAQSRKATSLIAAYIITISEELEGLSVQETDTNLKLKIYAILKATQQLADRMAVFMIMLNPEEELLVNSRINRLVNLTTLLKEYISSNPDIQSEPLQRIVQLSERVVKLATNVVDKLKEMEKDTTVFRSYSLIKTIFILHPRHWVRNLQLLFNFNTFTTRYALRAAIASTLALFLSKWFHIIDHGYWLPFTVIIVLQPYFGATLKKALDRVLGTVAGGIAGGLFLITSLRLYLTEILLFICYMGMVYFLRKRYSVAVFFITVSLVLLFDVENSLDPQLIATRAIVTIIGAIIAIVAGFALLPHWDAQWLPKYLGEAVSSNYSYFIATFFDEAPASNWTRLKRNAETKNSNLFDSFNRYMQEPGRRKSYASYYHVITHNVRVTRELNNIHLEYEVNPLNEKANIPTDQQDKLCELLRWHNKNMGLVKKIDSEDQVRIIGTNARPKYSYRLSALQVLYLDRMLIELKAMHSDLLKLTSQENE